ncbi:MAG: hypothetical protein O2960_24750 [Verrucomicrobia bacterium]|nr:hypothetical protein [Verrucomicrobiota bacterium]
MPDMRLGVCQTGLAIRKESSIIANPSGAKAEPDSMFLGAKRKA